MLYLKPMDIHELLHHLLYHALSPHMRMSY